MTTLVLVVVLEVLSAVFIKSCFTFSPPQRCKICRLKGIGKTLILCDDCNLAFHLECLRPALSEVPEGHWSCPICKPNERLSSRTSVKNYREDSSSEAEGEEDEASEASLGDSEDSSSEDETDEHEDYCHVCGEDGDLICCDTCPLVFHTTCHQPPLRNIPRGAWNCWQCRQPKNKKQKKNQQGNHKTKAKATKRKTEISSRENKRKRSRSVSSEESEHGKVSKRTRQKRQPMEISDDDSPRGRKRRARASIEELSDDDSVVGKTKASKSRLRSGDQAVLRNGSVVARLRRRYQQDSENEGDSPDSNVKSFYGRSTRRTRQQKVSSDDNSSEDDVVEGAAQPGKAARTPGRTSRRNKSRSADDSEDEDQNNEIEEKEIRHKSQSKKGSPSQMTVKSTRKSSRNQRRVSSSSENSNSDDKDVSKSTNQGASRSKRNRGSKQVLSSFDESDESGLNTSKSNTSKRRAVRNRCPEPNKSSKDGAKGQAQGRRKRTSRHEEDAETCDGEETAKQGKQMKGGVKSSSATKERQTQTRNVRRPKEPQENNKEKRRRANVEMDTCERILRDLILHNDSWPFTQAVNLREVPDYLELVKTPMDLGTIRDKLNSLEYPDVESFVADVRLVFDNNDTYNLETSEVGKAGKNLEKYFNKLFKQNFSNLESKPKVQRKR